MLHTLFSMDLDARAGEKPLCHHRVTIPSLFKGLVRSLGVVLRLI